LGASKGGTDETHTPIHAPTTTAVGRRHAGALHNGDKMKIGKKHQTFEALG